MLWYLVFGVGNRTDVSLLSGYARKRTAHSAFMDQVGGGANEERAHTPHIHASNLIRDVVGERE
jgi:hypothetical protein